MDALPKDPFEVAVERFVHLYRIGAELSASAAEAEAAFRALQRRGSAIRRRRRRGESRGAESADLAVIEDLTERLAAAIEKACSSSEMGELRRALAEENGKKTAALAVRVFAGLAIESAPEVLFRSMTIRRRHRDQGETLPEPAALAREIGALCTGGIPAPESGRGVPEPIVLAASWEVSAGELALRIRGVDVGPDLLHHLASSDWWCFRRRLKVPFVVCLAQNADDEWWSASPIPYPRYAVELAAHLRGAGIACEPAT